MFLSVFYGTLKYVELYILKNLDKISTFERFMLKKYTKNNKINERSRRYGRLLAH